MTKNLRKAIMFRSQLKNLYNKKRTQENWDNYKKQRNFCVNLLKKTKKEYFNKLNIKDLSSNKKFWKTIKPYFSNKGLNGNKFLLIENDNLISNEKDLASIFNNFFINITSDLHLKEAPKPQTSNESLDELLTRFSTHPSIKKIKESFPVSDSFNFRPVTTDDVKKEIKIFMGLKLIYKEIFRLTF